MIPNALWTESKLISNLQKPICQESQYTRDNHLVNKKHNNLYKFYNNFKIF
jgi:hypothetical protein